MNRETTLLEVLAAVGAGVAVMYFLDPNRGARRRALVTDKVTSAANQLPDTLDVTMRDFSNRAYGFWAETKKAFMSEEEASDRVVKARVRSKMGRVVSHPSAINVTSRNGNITLSGLILSDEVPTLLETVEAVPGVQSVENNLEAHDSPGNIPSLQGGTRRESRSEFMQENWTPAARFLAGTAGLAAIGAGLALLARSATNSEVQKLVGFGSGRSGVDVQKSINVNAPIDVVFGLWSNFENFPKFMRNVREVTSSSAGVSHWKVNGPAGTTVEWDAVVTQVEPDELIAWKSVEGSGIDNAGIVNFQQNIDGTTQVNVHLSYNPPAGALGHAVATIFGADPKTEMDEDLLRMKTLLETGEAPHDAAQEGGNTQTRSASS